MSARIEIPAELRGTPEQQIKQLYTYLFRLSEYLNVVLNTPEQSESITPDAQFDDELKGMIAKTAKDLEEHKTEPIYPVSVQEKG